MKKILTVFAIAMFIISVMAIGSAEAYTSITAAKAYQMATEEGATIIDVRTLEEYYWVGTCAAIPNGVPIAYNIPWALWTYRIEEAVDTSKTPPVHLGYYKPTMVTVETLFKLFITRTFPDKDTHLILMCRSGDRSTDAAKYLEDSLHYKNVSEIDNYHAEGEKAEGKNPKGGKGGFQGPSIDGYRGYPGRVSSYLSPYPAQDPEWTPGDDTQSVSWMDTGLPVTQKLDPTKIYLYMWLPKYRPRP
jgi:rhodanese-related sulfurtransferase